LAGNEDILGRDVSWINPAAEKRQILNVSRLLHKKEISPLINADFGYLVFGIW